MTITPPSRHTLKARYVFPVTGKPIPAGTVTIQNERIVAVGSHSAGGPVEDLGNMALLPGLVNPHTHLEFSELCEPVGEPGMGLTDWIRQIIDRFRHRSAEKGRGPICAKHPSGRSGKLDLSPFQATSRAVQQGLQESVRAGTTTLGEIAQPGWAVEKFLAALLETTVFLELIAPTNHRVAPLLDLAPRHVRLRDPAGHWRPGLSPHAPYSVLPHLLETAVELSATARAPLAFHLAESPEELELVRFGSGPFAECFEELGTCDPKLFPRGGRPLDYLRTLAKAHRALVIHGNYLDDEEIAFLAEHAGQVAVVYCPRTHAYFRHDRYPLEKMLGAGVTVALGTDSRASSPDLSVLAEMRLVAEQYPHLGGDVVLRLGTICGAVALGRHQEVGSLEPGKHANLAVVALPENDTADPHELLFASGRPVVGTWFRGAKVAES